MRSGGTGGQFIVCLAAFGDRPGTLGHRSGNQPGAVRVQSVAVAALGRRQGTVSGGFLAGGADGGGVCRPLGGSLDRHPAGDGGGMAHGPDRRKLMASADGGSRVFFGSGGSVRETGIFVKKCLQSWRNYGILFGLQRAVLCRARANRAPMCMKSGMNTYKIGGKYPWISSRN